MADDADDTDDVLVVEGPTIAPVGGRTIPLVVEPDRVVLGVCGADDTGARLLILREGSVANEAWVAHDLEVLDARHEAGGRRLARRSEDRTGRPFGASSTWHVSVYATPPTAPDP